MRARHDEVQAITDQQPLQVVDHQDEPDQQGEMNEASLQTTALYIYTRTYAHTHTGLLHQACFTRLASVVVLAVLNPRGALAQVDSCWLFNVMDTGSTLSLSLSLSLLRARSLSLSLSRSLARSLSLSLSQTNTYTPVCYADLSASYVKKNEAHHRILRVRTGTNPLCSASGPSRATMVTNALSIYLVPRNALF